MMINLQYNDDNILRIFSRQPTSSCMLIHFENFLTTTDFELPLLKDEDETREREKKGNFVHEDLC
jgi:hypothetical protein